MEAYTIKDNKTSIKATEKISGSEAIVRCLIEEDVKIIYGYPGGAIMPVYDELYKYQDKIQVYKLQEKKNYQEQHMLQ